MRVRRTAMQRSPLSAEAIGLSNAIMPPPATSDGLRYRPARVDAINRRISPIIDRTSASIWRTTPCI